MAMDAEAKIPAEGTTDGGTTKDKKFSSRKDEAMAIIDNILDHEVKDGESCENEGSSGPNGDSTSDSKVINGSSSGKVTSCSLHEHLHRQLNELISVAPTDGKIMDKSRENTLRQSQTSQNSQRLQNSQHSQRSQSSLQFHPLNTMTTKELLVNGKDDQRRISKMAIVTKLLDALREDQVGFANADDNDKNGAGSAEKEPKALEIKGRIHGCVGSHWELLPPVYPAPVQEEKDDNELNKEGGKEDSIAEEEKDNTTVATQDSSTTLSTQASTNASSSVFSKPRRKQSHKTPGLSSSMNFRSSSKAISPNLLRAVSIGSGNGGLTADAESGSPENAEISGGVGIPSPWSGRRRSWAHVNVINSNSNAKNDKEKDKEGGETDEKNKKDDGPKTESKSDQTSSADSDSKSQPSGIEPLISGGGIRLPGLDWNKTFRKGYAVLVWVRPTLDLSSESQIPERAPPRKQVLYRFATSQHDNSLGAVGVCAILGKWTAVPLENEKENNPSHKNIAKPRPPMMLTTTVTAYTLPNSEPMSHFYPVSEQDRGNDKNNSKSKRNSRELKEEDGGGSGIEFKGGSAHARNMEHFQKNHHRQNAAAASSASNQGRLVSKAKKSGRHVTGGDGSGAGSGLDNSGRSSRRKHNAGGGNESSATATATSPPTSGYVTAQITLPADEWSLVGIQHTHPYLRRPELTISVNGEEMLKGELGYPVLDGVIPLEEDGGGSISQLGSISSSPMSSASSGNFFGDAESEGKKDGSTFLDDQERKLLKRRGILAECSLLGGAFDNGVCVLDSSTSSTHSGDSKTSICSLSVHSLAMISGPPVPNAVLAMVAERGPLGDAASGSGLSFVLGPVPTNPQNRDAVVALSAGHGYYGSGGGSGSGSGVAKSNAFGGGGGIVGRAGGMHSELVPPRSLGIPVSIGITPDVIPMRAGGVGGYESESSSGGGASSDNGASETWIGGGEEHAAHVCLQGLLGRAAWTFHAGDTVTLGGNPSTTSTAHSEGTMLKTHGRIICQSSAAPSCIGGADAVPKVGIVRPTPPTPSPTTTSSVLPGRWSGLEVTGNASYHNVTLNYVRQELSAQHSTKISLSMDGDTRNDNRPPISFSRALQAVNAVNCALLPFRLALPRSGTEEVNDTQMNLHLESFSHLCDLLSDGASLAGSLIDFIAECIRCGGSSMKDEALQNGAIHVLVNLVRKVLIRGARLGLLTRLDKVNSTHSRSLFGSMKKISNSSNGKSISWENFDYDYDHDSSCPLVIPPAISNAMISLIDACCGPLSPSLDYARRSDLSTIMDPCRGLLRVRRASDSALTAFFGVAMDFDLLGNDSTAAAHILESIADRYCQTPAPLKDHNFFDGEDYGSLLRKQMNLQYFLDTIRVRFDHSVGASFKGFGSRHSNVGRESFEKSIESIASSLSDLLYTMLLSTLTSSAGTSVVTRGERDVGALVATLTECPFGSICAHIVTSTIAKLLVKCGVLSPHCLETNEHAKRSFTSRGTRRKHGLKQNLDVAALETRLGRNMLLCHYHDIVAPLLLSRSTPNNSLRQSDVKEEKSDDGEVRKLTPRKIDADRSTEMECSVFMDWSHHWRLSLFTFVWLTSLAGLDEKNSTSSSAGKLILSAAKAGSLDGALLGHGNEDHNKSNMLLTLSKFLVLGPSGEKDKGVVLKKAETISSRLSVFMQLLPGLAFSLLSPSFHNICSCDVLDSSSPSLSITKSTATAADVLKELLSMISLSIQSLYGFKKGGLLTLKAGTKGTVQLSKAKSLFVSAAKEYVPILLQVVSLLDAAIHECRKKIGTKGPANSSGPSNSTQEYQTKDDSTENQLSETDPSSETIQRKRTDSSDKDWVDVHSPKREASDNSELLGEDVVAPLSPGPSPAKVTNEGSSSSKTSKDNSSMLGQSVYSDLGSCQDIALYAVSRLVAQAMKYGGGEASTSVWRMVISVLSGTSDISPSPSSEQKDQAVDSESKTPDESGPAKTEDIVSAPEKAFAKSTLCHLAALVLSKFARHHDHRLASFRSPWNLETCSAVARLMDLIEEKELLSNPEQNNQQLSSKRNKDKSKTTANSWKYSIDQVRLLKSLLEVMASGRESSGWTQMGNTPSSKGDQQSGKDDPSANKSSAKDAVGRAVPHANYELYHQGSSQQSPNVSKSDGSNNNSKLLLPILQSCLRIVLPSMGIIRSEAVVISAASPGKSPSTAILLELVSTELHKSLTAAIAGLSFPISRDVFMNAVASLRRSISYHRKSGDSKAVVLCCNLLLSIVEAMRLRYTNERNRKEKVSYDAYDDETEAASNLEAAQSSLSQNRQKVDKAMSDATEGKNSQVVEKLILGGDLLPKSESGASDTASRPDDNGVKSRKDKQEHNGLRHSSDADFIAFPGDSENDVDPAKPPASSMGWTHYRGLGAALARCYRELNDRPSLGTRCLGPSGSVTTPEEKAKLALSILECYINNWDKMQAQDADEAELVDLFDESIHLGAGKSPNNSSHRDGRVQSQDSPTKRISKNLPCLSASEAMTRFIEAQSVLKHQHQYLAFEYLLSRRYGRTAFAERLCWKTWMDCVDPSVCNSLWERGVNDGGRDFNSKIATLPMFPQFPRFIPSYLDHSPSSISESTPGSGIDIATKNLVSKSIKIVDITKKEISEELLELYESVEEATSEEMMPEDLNDDEMEVFFPERKRGQIYNSQSDSEQNFDDANDEKEMTDDSQKDAITENSTSMATEENQQDESPEEKSIHYLASQQGSFHFATSSFSFPPDSNSLHSLGEGVRLGGGSMEEYYSSCLHVKPECSRKCIVMLTESHLILEYEDGEGISDGETESHHQKKRSTLTEDQLQDFDQGKRMEDALRPKVMRWNISETSHIYLRRYRLRDSALELFFIPSAGATTGGAALLAGSRSLFIDFGTGTWGNTRRDDAANAIMKRAPMQTVKQWPDKSGHFLHDELKKLTQAWSQGVISNFDYLLSLNCLAGRSYNDICQYPVMPWVLSNYTSEEVPDLTDRSNFRDLSKPMGALNELRLAELLDRFETFADPSIPPFMYGSHYSTSAGVVLHFLLRLHPFSSLHRQLQSGHFDVADRLFSSVQRTWDMCTGRSAAEVKELTPEFYSNPSFLRNTNSLKLGTSQDGEVLGDVTLPPWAKGSPEKFIEVMRLALESDICSEMLPNWIDLIFGRKQQGKAAIEANNVFFYLTYYGSVDVASIEDEGLRQATELQIAHFGQCPMQLFYRKHARKQGRWSRRRRHRRQTLSQHLGLYDVESIPLTNQTIVTEANTSQSKEKRTMLPFLEAPLSHWVHLGAPPPGPHAPLVSIRLSLADRCLAVDSRGIFHFFRWAWKPELSEEEFSDDDADAPEDDSNSESTDFFGDKGCFVAQRELFSFRNIPRLPYAPLAVENARHVTVGVSKTLFANRSLLLVLSDGDGKGGLAMQLVDPVKGAIRGEVIVPSAHADYVTSIDMDPIGTAAGQGGVGGELAAVGSADGSVTLWRFISSHYWPLRPRLRMTGHLGSKIHGVAVSSPLGVCASVSSERCCIFDIGNGSMIRNFKPPLASAKDYLASEMVEGATIKTTFADTQAICLSILGYVVLVCSTSLQREEGTLKNIFTLELMTLEGVHVGSRLLESYRGLPQKLLSTVDGRAVFVCAGGGVSVCLVSALRPLETIDEWRLSEDGMSDSLPTNAIYDLDFGPTIARPVVAAAGCSEGALRLHALQGISKWSHENQRNTMSSAVGSVLALPAQTVKNALGGVQTLGSRFVGFGKEIGKEAFSVVKEREGGFFFRKNKG